MRQLTIQEYLQEAGLLLQAFPSTVDELTETLEKEGYNFWSYCLEDKDEIKSPSITVLVTDGNTGRYFELYETV